MKKFIKLLICVATTSLVLTSCSKEEDFAIVPNYIPVVVGENYENSDTGSGYTEVAAATDGWLNVNFAGTDRVWNVKEFDDNNFAEFSSYYSNSSDPDDEVWLITSKMNFAESVSTESLTFDSQTRYSNTAELTVLISTDFDGEETGIHTATWEELTVELPTADQIWVNSGVVDLSGYQDFENVYVAFRYDGSKSSGATTTFRLDNIRVIENK